MEKPCDSSHWMPDMVYRVYLEGGRSTSTTCSSGRRGRGINSFHHKEPLYYYAITSWYGGSLWSLLSIGIVAASLVQRKIRSELEQFFTVIVLSSMVLLSLISAKLAIYSLPVIPFLIGLTIMMLPKFRSGNRWINLSLAIPAIILIFSLPALILLSRSR